jgi:hypothetical protein
MRGMGEVLALRYLEEDEDVSNSERNKLGLATSKKMPQDYVPEDDDSDTCDLGEDNCGL